MELNGVTGMSEREQMIKEIKEELQRHPEKILLALEWIKDHKEKTNG